MKQKLLIFGTIIILIIVLVGLNAASYVQKEKQQDSEFNPNRSSYNAGTTGTRAFYDLLAETGRKVVRWEDSADALLANKNAKNAPQTFVIIGSIKREFSDAERLKLLQWVSEGGKLVIIDREPTTDLVTTTANWKISLSAGEKPPLSAIDPSDSTQMTKDVAAAKPVQPTLFTHSINAVQPSRFATSVFFEYLEDSEINTKSSSGMGSGIGSSMPPISTKRIEENDDEDEIDAPETFSVNSNSNRKIEKLPNPPKSFATPTPTPKAQPEPFDDTPALSAPLIHLANDKLNLVVDAPYGAGQIVYLSDPYIVSNGGINLVDNAQLGINLVGSRFGVIAFDEYHQGYGTNNNRLLQYFAGTPVIAIFGQTALFLFLLFLSQSRRFARVVPEPEPNRLSKLEYVGAIAELQRRTKAFDLAIENIYTDFRRRSARLVGADNYQVSPKDLAKLIAERIGADEFEIYNLLRKCEDIMHGEPTHKKEVLQLSRQLRELEDKLGLKRNRRTKI
jgi:Domain of unknown function (DUF4350)